MPGVKEVTCSHKERVNKLSQFNHKGFEVASLVIAGVILLLTLILHLLPALLTGLLVYQLVHLLSPKIVSKQLSGGTAKVVVVALIAIVVATGIALGIWGVAAFLKGDNGNLPGLLQKMAEILGNSKTALPSAVQAWIPDVGVSSLQSHVVDWLKEHAAEIRTVGGETVHTIVHILFGLVIGAMVALREATKDPEMGPLARELAHRAALLSDSFRRVVFAQVKIAALNTVFTGIYLLLALPLFGIHLPLAKTMVLLTFLLGLIPVLGNLVSNSIIVIISLSFSPAMAGVSLLFLVVIHKLEYFMNAKIVGGEIKAGAWEMLLAMLLMEAAFKIPGVIFAPILYAYIKRELMERKMI